MVKYMDLSSEHNSLIPKGERKLKLLTASVFNVNFGGTGDGGRRQD